MINLEKKVCDILEKEGPLIGKELFWQAGVDEFTLWSLCRNSPAIASKRVGNRYLRLDYQVSGYARLSPSIMREFYGYTVVGNSRSTEKIIQKAEKLRREIGEISKNKLSIARNIIVRMADELPHSPILKENTVFMIAGDVVYGMAHAEPRPESSTGELVKGSDLDIIAVTSGLSDNNIKELDDSMYALKYKWLMNPAGREELDYIVKDIVKVEKQLNFDSFRNMIASKILEESQFLYGSKKIFGRIREMLAEKEILQKINFLREKAIREREEAEKYLLSNVDSVTREEWMKLFYTKDEKEEIF